MWRVPHTVGELLRGFFTARAWRRRRRCNKETKGVNHARLRCLSGMTKGTADSQRHTNPEPKVPLQAAAGLLTFPAT